MKKSVLPLLLLVMSSLSFAQQADFQPRSDTFTFNAQSSITTWDGSDPANPPYPYHMGSVNLTNPFPGINVPFELGYLNNGGLEPCDPLAWGTKTWIIGTGTKTGDSYVIPASTTCPYFTGEYGTYLNSENFLDGFNILVAYIRTFHTVCGRFVGCHQVPSDAVSGGTGTVTQTDISQPTTAINQRRNN